MLKFVLITVASVALVGCNCARPSALYTGVQAVAPAPQFVPAPQPPITQPVQTAWNTLEK